MTKTPRIEVDDDGEYVLLQSIRSILRVVGFLLFCSVVIMIGLGISQARINNKVETLKDSVKQVDNAARETRSTSEETRERVITAVERSNDPESQARLQAVFEAIFNMEQILLEEFGP